MLQSRGWSNKRRYLEAVHEAQQESARHLELRIDYLVHVGVLFPISNGNVSIGE
jgi:hypothetical protein